MASLPIRSPAASAPLSKTGAVAFAMLLLAAALIGLSSAGSANAQSAPVQSGRYVSAADAAGCDQLAARAKVIEFYENHAGCQAPVSCPQTGAACCGTTCHAAADQADGPRLNAPVRGPRPVGSALRLQVQAARPGMFRPPIG